MNLIAFKTPSAMKYTINLFALVIFALFAPAVQAQTALPLSASDGQAGDIFGLSVSMSSHVALVGAPGDDNQAGAVYVYTWDGADWIETQKIFS